MNSVREYISEHKDRFLNELIELLKIPSISADSKYKGDMLKAAGFIKEKLIAAGADNAEVCETQGHPIVYICSPFAGVVELVDTLDLGSSAARCASSSLAACT